ncbi:cobalamin biosynthesis protein CobD [Methanoculleus sp. FWC-SCC1]|uniref:Probable cobalamin biosynthesis protein CobD n=1 Tax=Methanoculleus frigidifontis TaxID=2584085 RepID=A0ABT8MA70_9EURY|nr:adenosylcobinamide-phosphate synthase CbiB [Methanoculleus sp. FWC-SCC1]MDN7024836.1 cobalamin biosynthesis protein CobD [Methanoculleus sp. FWC-SCC1]
MVLAAFVVAASLFIDRVIGDPRSPFHPVALLGRFIGWWGVPSRYPAALQRGVGLLAGLGTALLFAAPFLAVQVYAPALVYLIAAPFLLKVCFAWRALEEHTRAVVVAAAASDLEQGRRAAGMMVSRDTASLDREHVLSAAYESMTENLVDSIVSPLVYFGIFGLAGAAFFRAANTMDAMLGYRDEREQLGWFPARLDDLLNYIPARICGAILLVYFAFHGRFWQSYTILRRDARRRAGINGGIPMAAIAGGVGIRLEKPGAYVIGDAERSLDEAGEEIIRAVRAATCIFAVLLIAALFLLGTASNI